MTSSRRTFLGLVLFGPVSAARGQDELFSIEGSAAGDQIGYFRSFTSIGDVDGDDRRDLLVGEYLHDGPNGTDSGRVLLLSGASRAVIRSWDGASASDWFGRAIEDVLDLDGDGVDDFAVAAHNYPSGAANGRVYVYSGATGAELYEWTGEAPDDWFSFMRGVGDATGDGVNDVLVSALGFGAGAKGLSDGKVYLYSGADGTLVNSWTGASGASLGWRLGRLGFDADGDGCMDFAVGAEEQGAAHPRTGHVYVYSGKSQFPLATFGGVNDGDFMGYTNDAGDVDADGIPDLLVGSPYVNGLAGVVYLYSGKDWSLLQTWNGSAAVQVGNGMAMAGDVDGDGLGDLLFGSSFYDGAAGTEQGILELLSGANGRLLTTWVGEQAGGFLGFPVGSGGDLDGDDFPDQLVAAYKFDGAAGVDCGKLYALQGNDLFLDVEPAVASAGNTITLTTTAGVPGNLVIDVVTELDGVPMFLLLTPVLAFDSNGELVLGGVVDPSLGPHVVKLQSYAIGRSGKLVDSTIRTLTLQ